MAVYIDSSGRLHHDQESALALNCAHCGVLAHITPVSVPDYNALQQYKPSQVGLVYRCAACNAPVFLRFTVKLYSGSRVELAPNFVELERAREKFNFTYLPEDTEALVKEAFACYTAGCYNAFASMCRRAAQATFSDLGPQARLELFDELANIRRLAELDDGAYELVRKVLFDVDEPGRGSLPAVQALMSLLERDEERVQTVAASALGLIDDGRALGALESLRARVLAHRATLSGHGTMERLLHETGQAIARIEARRPRPVVVTSPAAANPR